MKRVLLATALATLVLSWSAVAGNHGHGHGHHGDGDDDDQGYYRHDNGRHEGWKKGGRVEVVYLQPRYYVEDYRVVHLAPPPPGHRWILVDGRYMLVAIATGVIADILLNH
jgi:Ni/Co efflux regulator RcnB